MLGMKEEAGNHDFVQKLLCLTVPKLFVEEPFSAVVQKISGVGKFIDRGQREGVSRFSVENFLSQKPEFFRRGNL